MLSFEVSDNSGEVNYHYKNRKKEKKKLKSAESDQREDILLLVVFKFTCCFARSKFRTNAGYSIQSKFLCLTELSWVHFQFSINKKENSIM